MTTPPTVPWGLPLLGTGDSIPGIDGINNNISNALNTALTTIQATAYAKYTTFALMSAVTGTVGQHATVTADATAINNGDYRWIGSAWVPNEGYADIATFSTGWAATNTTNHKPRIRRLGSQRFLYGAVTFSTGGAITSVLTVPTADQPPTTGTRFVGIGISNAGSAFQFAITAGVLSIPAGYYTSSALANAAIVPLQCMWWMD